MRKPYVLLLAPIVLGLACGTKPEENAVRKEAPPVQEPKKELTPEEAGVEEETFKEELELLIMDDRMQARQAVKSYVASSFPQYKVNGIALLSYAVTLYEAGVDLSSGSQRQTVNLIVRLFVADSGRNYWHVEPLTPDIAQSLSSYSLRKYKAKYKAEKSENEELKAKKEEAPDVTEP